MWRVILFTVLGLAALGAYGFLLYRAGWWAGQKKARAQLGIAKQRHIKTNEALVNEATDLFCDLMTPSTLHVDVDHTSYLCHPHASRVRLWLDKKRRNDR